MESADISRQSAPAVSSSAEPRDFEAEIARIDWSFERRARGHAIEAIHPYPAKFIGEIPRALLDILPMPKNRIVLDPFSGSGTTLVEAQRRGLQSVGVDLNPIACLIARVKTSVAPSNLVGQAKAVIAAARTNKSPRRSPIPNLDHWFRSDVQGAVAALVEQVATISDEAERDALNLALSSILVRVSNQDSDTRYAAIEKDVSRELTFAQFGKAVDKLAAALASRHWQHVPATVIEANTLSLDAEKIPGPVGLVITSPPYPNAYEYWLYHKYRMWWLGFDPIAVKQQEIGARAHFFKTKHHTSEHFYEQMSATLRLIDSALVSRGYACFVVGRSKIHGKIIDNASILEAAADAVGFRVVSRFERPIASTRKSFNLAHANIKREAIVILQKCKS